LAWSTFLTGSVVSSSQGDPRSTHDIDFVVNLPDAAVGPLVGAFPPPEYYFDESAVQDALKRRDMANLMEVATGYKVDFWILKDDPFDQSRFGRPVEWDLGGIRAFVSRPEDTIIQKLRWAEMSGGSEKQFGDAKSVYEIQFGSLDLAYMEQWARTLKIEASWNRLKTEATP
jgi:hypothetical protein